MRMSGSAAAAALEELDAELRLEALHLARERGLRDAEPLCRMADVALLDDRVKRAHILDFHTHVLPLRSSRMKCLSIVHPL